MSYGRLLLRNIFSSWAGLVINIIVSFFLAPFVVRSLGDTWYGVWVIMMQFTAYLYLMDFGVRDSIVRYISKHQARGEAGELNQIVNSALFIYGVFALLCMLVTGGIALLFPLVFNVQPKTVPVAQLVVLLVGGTIAQSFIFNVFRGVLLGLQRYDITHGVGVTSVLLRALLIVVFLKLGYGIVAMGVIQLGVGLFSGVLVYIAALHQLRKREIPLRFRWIPLRQQTGVLKNLGNYSFFVLINNLAQKAIFSSDALIIGMFMPAAAVTYYAIAGNLIEYLRRLSNVTAEVLNPLTSELSSLNQHEKIRRVLVQGSKLALLVGLPIATVYIFLGREFIGLWMGEKYGPLAGDVLVVLALGQILSFPHYTMNSLLYGMSRHHIIALWRIFEAVVNVVLSIVLVQYYGIIGVAIATVIPHLIVVVVVLPWQISRIVGMSLGDYVRSAYVRPLLAVAPFALLCDWAAHNVHPESLLAFFSQVALLMPIYLLSAWGIAFNRSDRRYYWSILAPVIPGVRRS